MTSSGGNVTYLSHGENKLNYRPLNLNIFADEWKIAIFFHRLFGIQKDDKIVYNNFLGKLEVLLHLGFPWPNWSREPFSVK